MLLKDHKIFCAECKEWYSAFTQVFLHVLFEGSISCEHDHLLGQIDDKEWITLFGGENENS